MQKLIKIAVNNGFLAPKKNDVLSCGKWKKNLWKLFGLITKKDKSNILFNIQNLPKYIQNLIRLKPILSATMALFYFAVPVHAYHLEYISGADPNTVNSAFSGNYLFRAFPESSGGGYLYDQLQGDAGTGMPYSIFTFNTDSGDPLNSSTSIKVNMEYYVTTSSNMPGEVFFTSQLQLAIFDYESGNNNSTFFSSDALISHTLNSITQVSLAWEVQYSFTPGSSYVIDIGGFYFWPYVFDHRNALINLYTGWKGDDHAYVECDWYGSTSLSYIHTPVNLVPEPNASTIFGIGVIGFVSVLRRKIILSK